MKLVTVATDNEGYMKWLIESSKIHRGNLIVLGLGEKWEGYSWKFVKMREFLLSQHPNEVICFVDAYDVIILKSLANMENEFKRHSTLYNKGLVVSLDIPPFYSKYISHLTFGLCDNKAINSGAYIGYSKDILDMINTVVSAAQDDQVVLTEYCKTSNNVLIDNDNIFFLSIGNLYSKLNRRNITIENGIFRYKGHSPYILHAFGNTYIDDIIGDMGYSITEEDAQIVSNYHTNTLKRKVKYYTKILIWKLLFLICIVVLIILAIKKIV